MITVYDDVLDSLEPVAILVVPSFEGRMAEGSLLPRPGINWCQTNSLGPRPNDDDELPVGLPISGLNVICHVAAEVSFTSTPS